MDSKKDVFRYVLMGVFIALAVGAVIVFATFQGGGGSDDPRTLGPGQVVMWGVFDSRVTAELLEEADGAVGGLEQVKYVEQDKRTFYEDFLEATALGQGPDLIIVDQSTIYPLLDKITPLTFEQYPQQDYKNAFIEGTEVYLQNGVLAIPFAIDPLVMFWNRDMFTNAGVAQPPAFWDEFNSLSQQLTRIDNNLNVLKSAVAFGEYRNVTNGKAVVSALLQQVGTPITFWEDGELETAMRRSGSNDGSSSAIRFYTDFSNPSKTVYSWNRSLPSSRDQFVAGDLAIYFGFASEASTLVRLNPNLNYDMVLFPQISDPNGRGQTLRKTYANIYAFVVPTTSRNKGGAFNVARRLSSAGAQNVMSGKYGFAPVRRDSLAQPSSVTYWDVVYKSAIISRTWIDPNPAGSDRSLQKMIENIQSGVDGISGSLKLAEDEIANYVR